MQFSRRREKHGEFTAFYGSGCRVFWFSETGPCNVSQERLLLVVSLIPQGGFKHRGLIEESLLERLTHGR